MKKDNLPVIVNLILLVASIIISICIHNGIFVWKFLLFFFVPILTIGLFVFLTLLLYFIIIREYKKKNINAIFITFLFAIVFIIHFFCIFLVGLNEDGGLLKNDDFSKIILIGFKEIYSQLGGLTFEGQNFDGVEVFWAIVYFGSIAWLAVTNAIIITFGVNYKFFSFVSLRLPKRKKRRFFIFTCANETSYQLAKNLMDYKEENEDKSKDMSKDDDERINCIIFSGDELEPFDKENQLHKQIFDMNFYYCPINKVTENRKKCIIDQLFNLYRIKKLTNFLNEHEIYIFALKKCDDGKGDEAVNSDIVFDDMELSLEMIKNLSDKDFNYEKLKAFSSPNECNKDSKQNVNNKDSKQNVNNKNSKQNKSNKNGILLNYYLLSNNNINFLFYSEKVENIFINEFKSEIRKIREDYFHRDEYGVPLFNLKILDEAIMSSDDLIDGVMEKIDENFINENFPCTKEQKNNIEKGFENLVIGFGEIGQAALGSLMLLNNCGKLDENLVLKPENFKALVIDENFSKKNRENNIIEEYKMQHPLFAFTQYPINKTKKDEYLFDAYKRIIDAYYPDYKNKPKNRMNKFENDIGGFIPFPLIAYSGIAYGSTKFDEYIMAEIIKGNFKSIIISLGNDEENIKCANYILKSIHQSTEYMSGKFKSSIQIYVNLKDSNNNKRININLHDNELGILVYIFGNYKDIYSKKIIDCKKEAYIYDCFKKVKVKKAENFSDDLNEGINKYYYLTEHTILENKINETSSKFIKCYEQIILKYHLKKEMSVTYSDYISNIEKGKKKLDDFCGEYSPKIIRNIKTCYKEDVDDYNVFFNFSNYLRLKNSQIKSFMEKDNEGYIWRYLIQVDNLIRFKLQMIYGYTYICKYSDIEAPPEYYDENGKTNFHKQYLLYRDDLLPFDNFSSFDNNKLIIMNRKTYRKRLFYSKEDDKYASIVALIAEQKDNKN